MSTERHFNILATIALGLDPKGGPGQIWKLIHTAAVAVADGVQTLITVRILLF